MGITAPEEKTIRREVKLKEIEQVLLSDLGMRETITLPVDH